MKVVVTGGGGYVGFHVGWAISQGGHNVILVDLTPPDPEWYDLAPKVLYDALPKDFWDEESKCSTGSLQYVQANINDYWTLKTVFQGATAVIHTASYGISGREQLSAHMTQQEEVNIAGTRTVLSAAIDAKVQALVYTSTYNVVFGGQEIKNGDESLPYFPLHEQSDHYSRTKTIAEMLVVMANGKSLLCTEEEETALPLNEKTITYHTLPLSSLTSQPLGSRPENQQTEARTPSKKCRSTLRTCALRLAGVMGLGERRHSCRVIDALRSGFLCTYGNKNNLVDFIGIQNVVQAHVKAMMTLVKEQENYSSFAVAAGNIVKSPNFQNHHNDTDSKGKILGKVSGQAYFISDGFPINHFEYFRPWYEGLEYGFPNVQLPLALIMIVAHVQQIVYNIIHKVYPFKPFITPAEVYKSGVTHYFSCGKATKDFGYMPTRPNDQTQMVEYFKSRNCRKDPAKTGLFNKLSIQIIFFVILCLICYLTLFR
ncbi:short-chain dehydrogenase/reductase family 42E member 1-like [Palaemon carinicauda]|uniref:short-chain dehydrogenase/reductase family 42E member 1-like n=1 Tax=Palaemon carinicauda TaxID=392227 RepID=UPI0035B609F8